MIAARGGVDNRTRAFAVVAVAALHIAAIAGLIETFGAEKVVAAIRSVAAFDIAPPPPPRPPPPPPSPSPRPSSSSQVVEPDRSSAPPAPTRAAATARPRDVAMPLPKLSIERESPVVSPAIPRADEGAAASGPGGWRDGSANGSGGGAANGGAILRRAEKVAGELKAKDFLGSGAAARDGRFVIVRYEVGVDGRVRQCRVIQSSGDPDADAITCRLIEKRFRYRPAIDARGRPTVDVTGWKQWWWR